MADKKLESITFPDLPDRYVVKPDIADVTGLQTALDEKADIDGTYDDMTVGNAEQLHSTVGATDTEPFSFRTSGGSLNIGDREELTLVGVDVGWNQLVPITSKVSGSQSGVDYTNNGDGSFTLNGTCTADADVYLGTSSHFDIVANHIYMLPNDRYWTGYSNKMVFKNTYNATYFGIYLKLKNGVAYNNERVWIQAVDLTAFLGSTIAEYILSLEQSTAGSGVAFFNKYFGSGHKAFDSGSLQSPVVKGIKMTGFNQFDEEWSAGGINTSTGVPDSDANRVHSTNYMRCVPSTTYYCKHTAGTTLQPFYYDADKNYIEYYSGNISNATFTTPANAYYMMFRTIDTAVAKGNVNINLHWDGERDGEYEPYEEHYYPISPEQLHGVMKLVDGKLYADGDVRHADGTIDRNYYYLKIDGDTTLNIGGNVSNNIRYTTFSTLPITSVNTNATNPVLVSNEFISASDVAIGNAYVTGVGTILVCVFKDQTLDTATKVKNYLASHPIEFILPRATPTTDTADPFTTPMNVDDWGTEEFIYNDGTTKFVPVGHSTKYLPNLKAKLEMSPDSPSGDGVYVVEQVSGINTYIPLASADTITSIITRIEALENA